MHDKMRCSYERQNGTRTPTRVARAHQNRDVHPQPVIAKRVRNSFWVSMRISFGGAPRVRNEHVTLGCAHAIYQQPKVNVFIDAEK